jgi:hypothetical protein
MWTVCPVGLCDVMLQPVLQKCHNFVGLRGTPPTASEFLQSSHRRNEPFMLDFVSLQR